VPSEQKGEKGMKLYCHNCVLYSRFGWTWEEKNAFEKHLRTFDLIYAELHQPCFL
jgi:hypothetical protein